MADNGLNDVGGNFVARQGLQNSRFGQKRVVESDRKYLRVTLSNQRARDAARSPARQRDFLTQWQLRKTRENLFFGIALEFLRYRRRKCKLREVQQVQIAEKTKPDKPRRTRMEG